MCWIYSLISSIISKLSPGKRLYFWFQTNKNLTGHPTQTVSCSFCLYKLTSHLNPLEIQLILKIVSSLSRLYKVFSAIYCTWKYASFLLILYPRLRKWDLCIDSYSNQRLKMFRCSVLSTSWSLKDEGKRRCWFCLISKATSCLCAFHWTWLNLLLTRFLLNKCRC